MKFGIRIKVALMVCSIAIAFFVGYGVAQSGYNSPDLYLDASTASYSFMVESDGLGYYRCITGNTGAVVAAWTSSNASSVIQHALDGLTIGRDWKEKVLLKGDFVLNTVVLVPSYVVIEIQGKVAAGDLIGSSLFLNSVGYGVGAYTDPVSRNYDIEFTGGIIDGNKDGQGAGSDDWDTICMHGVNDFSIHDMTLINGWTESIRTAFCDGVMISRCKIYDSADDGIAINELSLNVVIDNNFVFNAGIGKSYGSPNGIEIQDGSRDVVVSNNYVEYPNASGIAVNVHAEVAIPSQTILIANNVINKTSTGYGISFQGLSNAILTHVTVKGNSVFNTTGYGINAGYCKYSIISDNTVCNGSTHGIYAYYSPADLSILDNNVFGCVGVGICLNGDIFNGVIKGNVCVDNDIGVAVYADHVYVLENVCYNTLGVEPQRWGVCVYSGAVGNVVSRNVVYNHTSGAIYNIGTSTVISFNVGYVTENSFSGANTTATTAVINHGLAGAATYVWVSFNSSAITGYTWSSSATQVTITPAGTLPSSWVCYVRSEYVP